MQRSIDLHGFAVRGRDTIADLCGKLEQVLIAHRVRTLRGDTLITDTSGNPLLTIKMVERIVISFLVGDREAVALYLSDLKQIHHAFEEGRLKALPDHRGLGRRPLIMDSDFKVLFDVNDARATLEVEINIELPALELRGAQPQPTL